MHHEMKPVGLKYWSYLLVYTNDLLVIYHDPKSVMDFLASRYTIKEGSVMEPEVYLGARVKKRLVHFRQR
jgi:hypothetical protein